MNTFPISIEQGRSNILISECTHIDMDDVLWSTSIASKVRRYEEHNESALHIAAGVQLPKEVGTESLFPIAEEESTIGGVSGTRNGYPLDKLKDFVTENKLRDSAGFPRRFNYQVFFNKDSSGLTVTSVTADALFDARVRRHVQLEKKRKTSVIPDLQLLLMALKNWKGPNLPEKFKTEFLKLGEWEQLRVLEIAQDGLAIGRSLLQQAFQQVKVGSPAEDFLSDSFV